MPEKFQPGEFIEHKYQVEKLIRSDNEGTLYKCKYHRGYRMVKEIYPSEEEKDRKSELFIARYKALEALSHEGLIKIEEYFIKDGIYYVVMESVKGRTLETIYRKDYGGIKFEFNLFLQYMVKVCEALLYMNKSSAPCGNISPGNIMVSKTGKVKLIDYGLASLLRTGYNRGHESYGSPEQEAGKEVLSASDVYSMGAIIYSLLSGKKIVSGKKLKDLRSYNRDVSRTLNELIMSCLSRKIEERPEIEELSRQLSKIYLSQSLRSATRLKFAAPVQEEEDEEEEVIEEAESKKEEISGKEDSGKSPEKEDLIEEDLPEDSDKEEDKVKKLKKKIRRTKSGKIIQEDVLEKTFKQLKKKTKTGEVKKAESSEEIKEIETKENETIKPVPSEKFKKLKKKKTRTGEIKSPSQEEKSEEKVGQEKDEPVEKKADMGEKEPDKKEKTDIKEDSDPVEVEVQVADFDFEGDVEEDTAEEESEASHISEKPKKPGFLSGVRMEKKRRTTRTTRLSQMIADAIKTKKEEDVQEKEDLKEEKKQDLLQKTAGTDVKAKEDENKGAPPQNTRRSAIASFLRSKSGLSDEEYEMNRDLVKPQRRKSGLSEEFLASLKVTPVTSTQVKPGEEIKESRFLPYEKPDREPPLPLFEEIERVNDRYEILKVLHKDCYGAVYSVRDYEEKDEEKEEKILKEYQYVTKDKGNIDLLTMRFEGLCERLINLDNPNLARLEDYFYTESPDGLGIRFFFIIEKVEGMSFLDVAKTYYGEGTDSQMAAKTVFGVITKVSSALEYLHDNEIVFGDLRPSNIILTPDGNIKFLNYGFSKIFYGLSDEVYPCKGVYGYVAPELTCLPDGDSRSDIFSLGALLYFMLTNSKPEETEYKFINVRKSNPDLSLQVDRFIQTLLSFTPLQRPDVKQIGRVISNLTFFEAAKDPKSTQKMPEAENTETKTPASKLTTGSLTPVNETISLVSAIVKKIPIQLAAIIAGVFLLLIISVIWISGFLKGAAVYENVACVVLADNKGIAILDLATDKILDTLPVGECKSNMAFSSSRKELYFLSSFAKIFVLDRATMKMKKPLDLESSPYGIDISSDEKTLYITLPKQAEMIEYSIDEKQVKHRFAAGKTPTDLLFIKEHNFILISDFKGNKVFGIDIQNKKMDMEVEAGTNPRSLSYIPDLEVAYVANWSSNDISAIHIPSRKLAYTIKVGENPSSMALSADGKSMYVSNQKESTIFVIDVAGHQVVNKIKVEGEPVNLRISSEGQKLYVCIKGQGSNKISVLNSTTMAFEKDINFSVCPLNIFLVK